MFRRNSSTATAPRDVVDDPGTPVAETVVPDDGDNTRRIMTRRANEMPDAFDDDDEPVVVDEPVAERTVVEQPVVERPVVEEPVVPEPVAETVVEEDVEPKRWVHVSFMASLSLVVGTLALAATLTGLLAPLGFAAGILALILGVIAFAAVSRRNVTGHGLVLFGVLFGAVAVVLSVLVMGNDLSWLTKDTNEVTVVHNWLNDHMHWLRRF